MTMISVMLSPCISLPSCKSQSPLVSYLHRVSRRWQKSTRMASDFFFLEWNHQISKGAENTQLHLVPAGPFLPSTWDSRNWEPFLKTVAWMTSLLFSVAASLFRTQPRSPEFQSNVQGNFNSTTWLFIMSKCCRKWWKREGFASWLEKTPEDRRTFWSIRMEGGRGMATKVARKVTRQGTKLPFAACHWWLVLAFPHLCLQLHISWPVHSLSLYSLHTPALSRHAERQRASKRESWQGVNIFQCFITTELK